MQTPKGIEIEIKVEELTNAFENYLRQLFDEWKRVVSNQIKIKIVDPLFTINENKTISLNFAKEVNIKYHIIIY